MSKWQDEEIQAEVERLLHETPEMPPALVATETGHFFTESLVYAFLFGLAFGLLISTFL